MPPVAVHSPQRASRLCITVLLQFADRQYIFIVILVSFTHRLSVVAKWLHPMVVKAHSSTASYTKLRRRRRE